jgi:hypothetical protein
MPIRLKLPKPKKEWRYLVPEGRVEKFREDGFHVGQKKSQNRVVVSKRIPAWRQFEEEIRILFKNGLQLTDVARARTSQTENPFDLTLSLFG